MTDFLQELEEEQDEAFVVDDDQKADWAVRRIRELEADTKKWKEYYAEQLKRVTEQNDNSVMYFKGLLASYFAHVPHKFTKTAESYSLPSGTLRLKQQQPEYVREDESKIIEWAQKNVPDVVETVTQLRWADLKKLGKADGETFIMTETGEVVPGIKVLARPNTFEIEKK